MTQAKRMHDETRRAVRGMRTYTRAHHNVPSSTSATVAAWNDVLAAHWRTRMGDHPETEEIVSLLKGSLAPSTAENYGGHIARFVRWCDRQPDRPPALPAATTTVVRWLVADVVKDDRVRAKSLQPYLSALNRIHRDLEEEEPALGHVLAQVRRGVALRQANMGRATQRVYLPPPIVERVLLAALAVPDDLLPTPAECMARPSRVGPEQIRARLFVQAATAVVLTFAVFCRGHSGSALREQDVRRSAAGITVTLDNEKGKRVEGVARTITFPPGSVPGLEELLDKWERLRGPCHDGASYFAYGRREARRSFPATQIDTWLQVALDHVGGAQPPAGETWSGHSLRKGAASGAAAIDVAFFRICFMGGWAIQSRAVMDYIDATCPATPACRRFFGWLTRS